MITGTKMLKNLDNLATRRPITAQIQLCNFCNNACSYCRYVGMPVKECKSVSIDEFKQYVGILQGLGVKGFILTGGEPTISSDFDLITDWLEAKDIPYGINTNFNSVKYIKPRYLKISIDGYDAESYKEVRKVDKYAETIDNVKAYLIWKQKNNVQTTVGIQKIGTDVDECRAFYEAHKGLDVDYISFRPIETVNHSFYTEHDEKAVVGYLERLREQDKRVKINYKYYEVRTCFDRCYANFLQIAVNQNGEVIYCCDKSDEVVCHITDPDVLRKMAEFKTDMRTCLAPCRMTGPNALVRDMEKVTRDSMFI